MNGILAAFVGGTEGLVVGLLILAAIEIIAHGWRNNR